MSKELLIKTITEMSAPCADLKKSQIAAVLDALPEAVQHLLKNGTDIVAVPGLGRFRKLWQAERSCRNPKSGEPITVPAHFKVSFTPSGELKKSVRE